MDDLELIKQKINIVDLISEYIPVKKAGSNYKANCPFHNERTPSFMISPERGIWHCFGCDKGGDIFKFVMEKEGLEFKETLELLAQKAGVTLSKQNKEKSDTKNRLYDIHLKAAQFYHYLLTEHKLGEKALKYLKNRGVLDETIKQFNLGYAPDNWEELSKFLKKRGFTTDEMTTSGLCVPSKRDCYDRFRGRIMFPLYDLKNKVIGFSGRIVDHGEPKYINSPQTPIFDKKRFLFGIQLAKSAIKEKGEAIIVEGEMDMILSYQSGVKNIVASKGTAFTPEHIELIQRFANSISLCFDTDLAGDAASRRGIDLADQAGLNIKVIEIKDAKDPADLCLKDATLWEKAVEEAVPIYDYYLDSVAKRFNLKDASSKKLIFAELAPIWKKIADPIVKEHYTQKLAAFLQVKEDLIRQSIERFQTDHKALLSSREEKPESSPVNQSKPGKTDSVIKPTAESRRKLLEEYLLALLLHIPADHTYIPNFPETIFTQEHLKQIYVLLVLFLDNISFKGRSFKITDFSKSLPPEFADTVDKLYLIEVDEKLEDKKLWQKDVDTVVLELKKTLIKQSLEKLSLQIKNAQEFGKVEQLETLNKRFRDLSVKLKTL